MSAGPKSFQAIEVSDSLQESMPLFERSLRREAEALIQAKRPSTQGAVNSAEKGTSSFGLHHSKERLGRLEPSYGSANPLIPYKGAGPSLLR
jgi:hypothetical protein